MYCSECGKENPDGAQFCNSCNSALTSTPTEAPAVVVKTSGMAIAALVLGILSIFTFGLTAIPALIFGIISLVIIEKSGGRITGRGFAITGIVAPVLGLVPLMAILMPALTSTREQGKRAVCLNNLKLLTLAWMMYADENDDKIVNGVAGSERAGELPWLGKDWGIDYESVQLPSEEKQTQALKDGELWPYCKNTNIYRCPAGLTGHMRTYSIVDSMNGLRRQGTFSDSVGARVGTTVLWIKKRTEIRSPSPAYRFVFIDVGQAIPDSYSVYYDQQKWWDEPPVRHGDGTNISFADGHAEYWKWRAAETVKHGKAATSVYSPKETNHWPPQTSEGREDLYKMQKGCWGRLGYTPTYRLD
ncbi:MAG: DUF4190 domain-containing protein [Planctomycetota bacterium]|jgi:prepilin-type processing-associated H-X9-DG protein